MHIIVYNLFKLRTFKTDAGSWSPTNHQPATTFHLNLQTAKVKEGMARMGPLEWGLREPHPR